MTTVVGVDFGRGSYGRAHQASAGYWGMAMGLHPREARRQRFAFPPEPAVIRALGASHVLLTPQWHQRAAASSELAPGSTSLDDRTIARAIRTVRNRGMGAVLMPIFVIDGGDPTDWRGTIRPADPARWWQSYSAMVLRYARLAARLQVSLFVVGSELSSMSQSRFAPQWRRLTARVRQAYRGPIAYVMNHDALDLRAPLDFVDVVGVSAYFPLTTAEVAPTRSTRARATRARATRARATRATATRATATRCASTGAKLGGTCRDAATTERSDGQAVGDFRAGLLQPSGRGEASLG